MPGRPSLTRWLALAALLASGVACAEEATPGAPEILWLPIGGETFQLELALDPEARFRGLAGRAEIPPGGGMLFVEPRPRPMAMVMRDCPVPIDVAFLDSAGRVLAIHAMPPEPARRPDEAPGAYERRLIPYPSGGPAQFAIETAGGRLGQLGLRVGDRVPFDAQALVDRSR